MTAIVKGFTLIETLIVIMIVAVSLSLAVSTLGNSMLNAKLKQTTDSLLDAINLSRSEAIKRSEIVRLTISADGSWVMDVQDNGNFTRLRAKTATTGLSVSSPTNQAASIEVDFDSSGYSNKDFTINVEPDSGSCTKNTCLNIEINRFGKVKMCNPKSTLEALKCSS